LSKFLGDYHTHTFYSDGVNTAKGIVEMARAQGYKEIAITDHGIANKFGGLNLRKIKKLSGEIDELRKEYPDLTIYQGYEGDLISFDGTTDITDEIMEKMDVILLGFHRYITPKSFKEIFTFVINNGFFSRFFGYSEKLVRKNTDAILTALRTRRINILAHISHNMKVNCREVAEECAKRGIYVELNIKHLDLMEKVIDEILPTGCLFIGNTDSHNVRRVNSMDKIYDFIVRHNIPPERVVNLGRLPDFKNQFRAE